MKENLYDHLAKRYEQRYLKRDYDYTKHCLLSLLREHHVSNALEVGCGTGYWLRFLQPNVKIIYGLDLSLAMLKKSLQQGNNLSVILGNAGKLPFVKGAFNLVLCVNAFHIFKEKENFIQAAHSLLKPSGVLAIIGMNPRNPKNHLFIYDYFNSTYETDLKMYPPKELVVAWMRNVGMNDIQSHIIEEINEWYEGEEVLHCHFLQKDGCTQLALLSGEDYRIGIKKIKNHLSIQKNRAVFLDCIEMEIIFGIKSPV
jgi:ubiquinone/menaquinone biosynthesis C-methylase UbiE